VDSALAQTYAHQEIIIIDDGSTDGTPEMLRQRYGDRVCCIQQANGGVSRARNNGMRRARGEFVALLDSDDVWAPEKLQKQVAYLLQRPDFGMVLCDVQRVDSNFRPTDVLRRREAIPRDGNVLPDVLMFPTLVPASIVLRSVVLDQVGPFDESLRTAEDIEFHLRVASRFPIGTIDESLVFAMRGHDGLSEDAGTQIDYVGVMERFIRSNPILVPAMLGRKALFRAYTRNARSAILSARMAVGMQCLRKGLREAQSVADRRELVAMLLLAARVAVARTLRRLR
jgi:glycosyltransferase involved in cell wall biosynthesis